MAKDLSGTGRTTENIRAQIEKETDLKFKIAKIALIVLATVIAVKSGIAVYGHYAKVQELSLQIEQEQTSYDTLKAEAEAWHKENDKKQDSPDGDGSGKVISEVQLPSAKAAGMEVAALQNKLYADGLLTVEDSDRLKALCSGTYGGTRAWYTGDGSNQLDPSQTALEWRFGTWYDAVPDGYGIVPKQYDCVWTCWHTSESGTEYMVAAMFGSYLAEQDVFNTMGLYISNFGEILAKNGSIEKTDDNEGSVDPELDQMIGELTGEGDDSSADGETEGETEGVTDVDGTEPEGDGETSQPNGNGTGTQAQQPGRDDQSEAPPNA